jgi:hypothetical protein
MLDTQDAAAKALVFSGGACNIRDAQGQLLRNEERDAINDWLTKHSIAFYDPQIHPDTHGVEYDYATHHPLEVAARQAAQIALFEISPRTFGGVAAMEIGMEEYRPQQPTIIFFSDGNAGEDVIPAHTDEGYPTFTPYGVYDDEVAMRAHYEEFIKNANRMRKYALRMARDLPALTVTFNETAYEGDVLITPDRMHAVEIFEAIVTAASGRRVIINFTGGDAAMDEKGYPRFNAPKDPPASRRYALLDQYTDEGNALRRAICDLVRVNVFVRVVYTQRAAITALEDLLAIKGVKVDG